MAESILEMLELLKDENHLEAAEVVDLPEWAVFEVPAPLRAETPSSFQNKGLELGLHRRTLQKSQIEVFKVELARVVHLKLTITQSSWEHFARDVVGDVTKARRAYSTSSAKFTDQEVQNLLALDALFLVVLFKYVNGRAYFWKEFHALADRLSKILPVMVKSDFYLIENQVPMYLLQSIIKQLYENDEETQARIRNDPAFKFEELVEDELEKVLNEAILALNPFTYPENTGIVLPRSRNSKDGLHKHLLETYPVGLHKHLLKTYPVVPLEKSLINCQHLLDCIYRVLCGHSLPFKVDPGVHSNLTLEGIPSASRLETIGIRVEGTVPTLNDIKLSGKGYLRSAKLQLPSVELCDYSESAFRNLALYEQQTFGDLCGDFRCYLQCMASLCINVEDVQLLAEQGVINNDVGKDILVGMWDRILWELSTPCPSSAWQECYTLIHQHRNAAFKQWRHECWVLFFARPWRLVSVLAGILLLFLTAVQTWLTAFPPKGSKLKG